jgi:tetratricopeptide (TPR) repeat protein
MEWLIMKEKTGLLSLLLISLVFCLFSCSNQSKTREITDMKNNYDEIFTSFRAQYSRQYWETVIFWGNPVKISVSANDDIVQKFPPIEKFWKVEDVDLKDMQKMLKDAVDQNIKKGKECLLDITNHSGASINISYDKNDETEALSKISKKLESLTHLYYVEALYAFSIGEKLLERKMFNEAIGFFSLGIETLGDLYKNHEIIDDTDAKLIFAEHNYKRGLLEESATLYNRVIESRLQVYQRVIEREVDENGVRP